VMVPALRSTQSTFPMNERPMTASVTHPPDRWKQRYPFTSAVKTRADN
jgi:hypothetical protein